MAAPNATERLLIEQFREDVRGILDEEQLNQDHFLLRWIRARENNLVKAKAMLEKYVKWRQEKQVDKALDTPKSAYFEKNFKYWLSGHDKEGRPILVCPNGTWDIKTIVKDGKAEELIQEHVRIMEDTMKRIRNAGKMKSEDYPVTQYILLCDGTGFEYRQVSSVQAIAKICEMGAAFEGYYPETIYSMYLINCPALFSLILPILKSCMCGNTLSKLHVFGTDKEKWLPELLKTIDPENLFPEHGGVAKLSDYKK